MTAEDLKAISNLMDQKLAPVIHRLDQMDQKMAPVIQRLDQMDQKIVPVIQRLDQMDQKMASVIQRLDQLEESNEEIRNGVNSLIGWAEKVSMAATFPLPDIDD